MFQSEHLVEKWAPLLEHEGCESIKDNHRKAVTAVLLENQEKFLREQNAFAATGSFLTEQPTNSVGAGGYTGAAADAGPVAGFDPVLISLIRRSMPNLVAYDLAGVQPMSAPTGLIFAMRSKYNDQTGPENLLRRSGLLRSLVRMQTGKQFSTDTPVLLLAWVQPHSPVLTQVF